MSSFAEEVMGQMDNKEDKDEFKSGAIFDSVEKNQRYLDGLVNECKSYFKGVKIRVPKMDESVFSIDEDMLITDMQDTMVYGSHLNDDIYAIKSMVDEIKNIEGTYVGILSHLITKKGNYRIKNVQELDAYLNMDKNLNEIRSLVAKAQAKLEQYKGYKKLIDQKLFFLGGILTKRNKDREEENERD